jgi:hypothetical protein
MNKKLLSILLIATTLMLSGCFSSDGQTTTSSGTDGNAPDNKVYQNSQFSLSFPGSWDVIEPKDFTSEIPPETQLVIRNNIKNDTFTANINVVRNDLQLTMSSLDYAKEIINRQRTGLLDYKETKRDIINIQVGGQSEESYYTEFEARLNQTDPVTKFVQTYAVKDKAGFIIMGSYSTQENTTVVDQVNAVVKSFKVN